MASPKQSLAETVALRPNTLFNYAFVLKILREIENRVLPLEDQQAGLDAVIEQLRGVALTRINEVLTPAIESILEVQERGYLKAGSTSPNTLGTGDILTWVVGNDAERALFTPSAFTVASRTGTADDYAVVRTLGYDNESGEYIGQVVAFFGDPGPHDDWEISAVAGSTLAQLTMLATAEGYATTASTAAGTATGAAGIATEKAETATGAAGTAVAARNKADAFANAAEDTEVEPDKYSGRHYALKAAASAAAAALFDPSSYYTKTQIDGLLDEVLDGIPEVLATVASPADGATGVREITTVEIAYYSLYGKPQKSIRFQIDVAAGDFSSPVYDSGELVQSSTISGVPPGHLNDGETAYKIRAMATDIDDVASGWSEPTSFTTIDVFTNVVGVALVAPGGGSGTWAHIDEAGNAYAVNQTYFGFHPVFGGIVDETIDGQAMMKVPAFYYKVGSAPGGADHAGKTCWWISDAPFTGASLHPAFMVSGSAADQFWVGKYQGTDDGGTKLGSVAGNLPLVSKNFGEFRTLAAARNTGGVAGFMLWSIYQLAAIQMLYLVEYANGDCQAAIGDGRVNQSNAANVDAADVAEASYRGIVGLWGNVFQFADGLDYASDEIRLWDRQGNKTWIATGVTDKPANNYILSVRDDAGASHDFRDIFFPETTTSEGGATFADRGDTNSSGDRIYAHGGSWSYAANAGLFFAGCNLGPTSSSADYGARLARVT